MNNSRQLLQNALHSLATTEQIAETLGIQEIESQTEEFWETQHRAVKHRFYWFCLSSLGIELSTEIEDLEPFQLEALASTANHLLHTEGFNYGYIRDWYKTFGSFAVDKAFKHRRELRDLETRVLRVLVIFDKGAKYLAYKGHFPVLVDSPENAYTFKINSITEISKAYLSEMPRHFNALLSQFGAKQIKVLPGRE